MPAVRKVEIRASKSPIKYESVPQKPTNNHRQDSLSKLQKLFRHLTKCNPSSITILSPEHINLKGLDRCLLTDLQEFFEKVDEDEFEGM
jgi:hypothetical protein